jgi:hypothetical protein
LVILKEEVQEKMSRMANLISVAEKVTYAT